MIKIKTSPDWHGIGIMLLRIVLTGMVVVLAIWVMSLSYLLVTSPAT